MAILGQEAEVELALLSAWLARIKALPPTHP